MCFSNTGSSRLFTIYIQGVNCTNNNRKGWETLLSMMLLIWLKLLFSALIHLHNLHHKKRTLPSKHFLQLPIWHKLFKGGKWLQIVWPMVQVLSYFHVIVSISPEILFSNLFVNYFQLIFGKKFQTRLSCFNVKTNLFILR